MWARIVECMLGVWLLISPFIFHHSGNATHLWINDLTVGLAVIVLSLASYWSKTRAAHWLILVVAIWLVGFGRLNSAPPLEAALQNSLIIGLLLGMMAIVPNEASLPPVRWRQPNNSTLS